MSNEKNLKVVQLITAIVVAAFFVGIYTLKGDKITDEVHNEPAISQSFSAKMDSSDTEKNTSANRIKDKKENSDTSSDTESSSDTNSDTDTESIKDTDTDTGSDTDSEIDNSIAETVFPYSGVWNLIIVNKYNPIPDDYEFNVEEFENGKQADSRIIEELSEMFYDMRAIGLYPVATEAYRTSEDQQAIMDEYIAGYIEQGKTNEQAVEEAKKWVAQPGTSEHEIGLALDINPDENTESYSNTDVYTWLAQNAYKYGFILRYPKGKEQITGIDYEPWHYRYVGKTAAEEIFNSGLCLEEYLAE